MNRINYCEAKIEDHPQIIELINLIHPYAPWSKKYFKWQYFDNPVGKAKIWIAKYKNQVIANYAAIPHILKIKTKEKKAWLMQDLMVHPQYRKQGIAQNLCLKCEESISSIKYTFPTRESSRQGFLRRNWIEAFKIPLRIANITETIINLNVKETLLPSLGDKLDDLWSRIKHNFLFTTSKTFSYLMWRYFNKPNSKYFFFAELQDNICEGLIIIKYYKKDNIIHICDCFGEQNTLKNLLLKAFKLANNFNARKISVWLPQKHPYESIYNSLGFKFDDTLNHWFTITSKTLDKDIYNSKNWHLSLGDSDVY